MSDFSVYLAGEIVDWMSQGTQLDTPPGTIYLALFDDTGTEVSGDFQNDRVATTAGTDWTVSATEFTNANEESFGEAATDLTNISDIALYDADLATGGNELARATLPTAPFDVSSGTVVRFNAGQLTFDVLDRTE